MKKLTGKRFKKDKRRYFFSYPVAVSPSFSYATAPSPPTVLSDMWSRVTTLLVVQLVLESWLFWNLSSTATTTITTVQNAWIVSAYTLTAVVAVVTAALLFYWVNSA